jgi:hypothetical protein
VDNIPTFNPIERTPGVFFKNLWNSLNACKRGNIRVRENMGFPAKQRGVQINESRKPVSTRFCSSADVEENNIDNSDDKDVEPDAADNDDKLDNEQSGLEGFL